MRRLTTLARNVWSLARGYWSSEERWSARILLAAIIALNLGMVYVSVLLNTARGTMYNGLQARDATAFYSAFGTIVLLILAYLAVALLRYNLNLTLQLRWRRWLTDRYLSRWLADRAFYRMRFFGKVDNPDQRISEDVRLFIEQTLSLGLGLLSSIVTLASFATILWDLSGSVTLPIGDAFSITIPGYMFWAAVLYAGIASVLAHLVGRPLIPLSNRQQGLEADFRFSLVRLREEAEGIALYGGEKQERGIALGRFRALYDNFKRLIVRRTKYLTFEIVIGQAAAFFPLLVASPRYFSGAIQLGGLMQTSNAFQHVNDALSWFVGSYTTFAEWRATVDRLLEFGVELSNEASTAVSPVQIETALSSAIDLDSLAIALPDGSPLIEPVNLTLKANQPVLLKGESGSGKSTIFRVLAGLWPFATGHLRLPAGAKPLFLPQRPYMPIGSLREALWFPAQPDLDRDEEARNVLAAVGLPALAARLDESAHWTQILSGGEQQRLAIARALLIKPDWLFLDEATSAIDEDQEAMLYRTLMDALPGTTIVSIGHRRSLAAYHDRVIVIERQPGHPGRLVEGLAAA
jgi:vitamin B12/bleomycin/antimicrobial peptide transport system ATP-binding/permease protein